MKVKELIEELSKIDQELYVEIGYTSPLNGHYHYTEDNEQDLYKVLVKNKIVIFASCEYVS